MHLQENWSDNVWLYTSVCVAIEKAMTAGPRRSKRIEAIKDELAVSAEKPQPLKKEVVQKVARKTSSKGKVTKDTGKGTAAKKESKAVTPKGKSSSAKKEPVAVDDDEGEEQGDSSKKELEEGDSLPGDLELETQDSKKINLLKLAKDAHILVIFAYPKASTPGCTRQALGFRDEYPELNGKLKATVLGLSADSANAQTKFKEKQKLPYDLLCDTGKKLITLLGCKKSPSGIIRSHFIFVDGVLKVKKVKVSPEVSFKGALEQVADLSK